MRLLRVADAAGFVIANKANRDGKEREGEGTRQGTYLSGS